ncbi:MAG: hypothetical protein HDS02_01390 [Bacteroides sp.]|nr:hypothetical protein [Bacteroides sp.]MBD5330982.1 hypothetical protein [Bacteroides sp.]
MADYVRVSTGQEYRIKRDQKWIECDDHQNKTPFWRDVAVAPHGRTIVDIRENRFKNDFECQCDDGRWYERNRLGGLSLTQDEQANDYRKQKEERAAKKKSRKELQAAAKASATEQKKLEQEQVHAAWLEGLETIEADYAEETALKEALFGADYETVPYPEKISRFIRVMIQNKKGSDNYRKGYHELYNAIEGDIFEVAFDDWVDGIEVEKTSPSESEQFVTPDEMVLVSRLSADFVTKFPTFDGKYPELCEERIDAIFAMPQIDNKKPPFYDILGKRKHKMIAQVEDELTSAITELRWNINNLRTYLVIAERESRRMLRTTYDYKLMVKNGTGSKLNFWGNEKSSSPLSIAKHQMESTYERIADTLVNISKKYDSVVNEYKTVSKLYTKLYKLTKDPNHASALSFDMIKGDGLAIAEAIHMKGRRAFKNNSLNLGLQAFSGIDKRERYLANITDEELKKLFSIRFDLTID